MKDGLTIFYLTVGIGGIMGGILTAINKVRFVKRKDFDDHVLHCPAKIGKQIETVAKSVSNLEQTVKENAKESKERREKDNQFVHDHLLNIAQFVGRVEQYMTNKKL